MTDVLIELAACCDGCEVGGVAQGRDLVAEVRTCDNGTCGCGQGHTQSGCDTHQSHTHGCDGTPGGTGANGDDGADQEAGDQHPLGIDDLNAVVNQHGNGTGQHPGTDQCADNDQDQNGGHTLCGLLADAFHHFIPSSANTPCNESCKAGNEQQQGLSSQTHDALTDGQNDQHNNNGNNCFEERGGSFCAGRFSLFCLCHKIYLQNDIIINSVR